MTITTWRDLTDQLTPEQVAQLEHFEVTNQPPGQSTPERRLAYAQTLADTNAAQRRFASVPAPAGAEWVGDWTTNRGGWDRFICMWSHGGDVRVEVSGYQRTDGSVPAWEIALDCGGTLTAAQARQLARDLITAADKFEALQ